MIYPVIDLVESKLVVRLPDVSCEGSRLAQHVLIERFHLVERNRILDRIEVVENYKKIRNTFRYILSNLYDFDPVKDAVPFGKMEALDQYMRRETAALPADVRN